MRGGMGTREPVKIAREDHDRADAGILAVSTGAQEMVAGPHRTGVGADGTADRGHARVRPRAVHLHTLLVKGREWMNFGFRIANVEFEKSSFHSEMRNRKSEIALSPQLSTLNQPSTMNPER